MSKTVNYKDFVLSTPSFIELRFEQNTGLDCWRVSVEQHGIEKNSLFAWNGIDEPTGISRIGAIQRGKLECRRRGVPWLAFRDGDSEDIAVIDMSPKDGDGLVVRF